jgi:sugar phosphate isomerase/epimerase
VEESAWRLECAAAAGITYGVEPHVGSLCPDPERTLDLLDRVPGLTLTLDYGHFIYQDQSMEPVHALISRASHFHARGGAPGKLQATMDENQISFPDILTRMHQAAYKGWICLEYVWVDWEGCNRTDNVAESIRLRDLLRSS